MLFCSVWPRFISPACPRTVYVAFQIATIKWLYPAYFQIGWTMAQAGTSNWSMVSLRKASCLEWSRERFQLKKIALMPWNWNGNYNVSFPMAGSVLGRNSSRICRSLSDYRSDDSGQWYDRGNSKGRAFWVWWIDWMPNLWTFQSAKIQIFYV